METPPAAETIGGLVMSSEMTIVYRCDWPPCTSIATMEDTQDMPEGWRDEKGSFAFEGRYEFCGLRCVANFNAAHKVADAAGRKAAAASFKEATERGK